MAKSQQNYSDQIPLIEACRFRNIPESGDSKLLASQMGRVMYMGDDGSSTEVFECPTCCINSKEEFLYNRSGKSFYRRVVVNSCPIHGWIRHSGVTSVPVSKRKASTTIKKHGFSSRLSIREIIGGKNGSN